MDPLIYFVADLYPWWGIPLAFIFFELANRYRRRRDRKKMMLFLSISGFFLALACLYFFYNGFEHLRPAMKDIDDLMKTK